METDINLHWDFWNLLQQVFIIIALAECNKSNGHMLE